MGWNELSAYWWTKIGIYVGLYIWLVGGWVVVGIKFNYTYLHNFLIIKVYMMRWNDWNLCQKCINYEAIFFFAQKSKNVFPIQLIIGFTSCLLFSKTKKCCQFISTNWIGFYTKIATLIYWRYIPKQLSCSSLHFFFSPYSWNMIWFWSLFYSISNRKYLLLLLL